MVEYQSITTCRMTFLREQLDDPGLTSENSQCGRCDNCTGNRYDTTVDTAALDETRARLQRPGFDLEPRKMWPTGLSKLGVKLSGRSPRGGPKPGAFSDGCRTWAGGVNVSARFSTVPTRGTRCGGQRVYQRSGRLELGRATHRCHGPRIHDASFVGVEPGCQVGRGRAIDRPGHPSLATRPPSGVGSELRLPRVRTGRCLGSPGHEYPSGTNTSCRRNRRYRLDFHDGRARTSTGWCSLCTSVGARKPEIASFCPK